MKFFKGSSGLAVLVVLVIIFSLASCEEDFNTIGADIINNNNFNTQSESFNVFASTRNLMSVQTNGLSAYQLGELNNPIYGARRASIVSQLSLMIDNPRFGVNSQEQEDEGATDNFTRTIQENEVVTRVFLNIPFFTANNAADTDGDGVIDSLDADPEDPNSDSDNDGVTDNQERLNGTNPLDPDTDGDGITDDVDTDTPNNIFPLRFELDSIFGNREATFDLRVDQSTFFLRDLDPDTNFQEAQEFFSNMDFSSFVGTNLFDGSFQISDQEVIIFNEDNPNTPDTDESITVNRRIPPGIRVELDPVFFQQNLVDREGDPEIANNLNFREFLRGIRISTSNHSDDLYMLLNLNMANIEIEYTFDRVNENGTANDPSDDTVEQDNEVFTINLVTNTGGIAVNTFETDPLPSAITNEIDRGIAAERLYLDGGSRTIIEMDLFDEEGTSTILEEVRAQNLLINEANLTFFIDRETLDLAGGITEPDRIYLYNIENNTILADYSNEVLRQSPSFNIFDGNITRNDLGNGIQYRVRVTEHINNIIRNDSTNVKLGLTITSDITNPLNITGVDGSAQELSIPQASVVNPFGTVLFGSSATVPEDRRLKLEIFFTEPTDNNN
ncbi:DUF4270 family protein [Flavobacteriaceae bacterium R38]|nr:DUF4270 family protein [Flavobacteriaceae bacterium R38]